MLRHRFGVQAHVLASFCGPQVGADSAAIFRTRLEGHIQAPIERPYSDACFVSIFSWGLCARRQTNLRPSGVAFYMWRGQHMYGRWHISTPPRGLRFDIDFVAILCVFAFVFVFLFAFVIIAYATRSILVRAATVADC